MNYPVKGIDVSKWQGIVDWPAVAQAGYAFAAARATVGEGYVDPCFRDNWQGMKAAGIARAAYHVLLPTVSPQDQIDRFLTTLENDRGELPLALDVELSNKQSNEKLQACVRACLAELHRLAPEKAVMIYTAPCFWDTHLAVRGEPPDLPPTELWVANYTTAGQPTRPRGWASWRIWQWSNSGHIPGIARGIRVDLNVFNGSPAEFRRWAGCGGLSLEQRVERLEKALERLNVGTC